MSEGAPFEVVNCNQLPGPSDSDRQLHVTLMRVHHACENLDSRVESVGYRLADYLQDPEPLYVGRLLQGAIESLLRTLDDARMELRKASKTFLPLAKERYERSVARDEADKTEERLAIEAE